jgi:hypothetical protein
MENNELERTAGIVILTVVGFTFLCALLQSL